MPRDLSTEVETASTSPKLSPIALVDLVLDSGHFRMWTGWGTLLWGDLPAFTDGTYFSDGTTWTDLVGKMPWYGAGNLGAIGAIGETTEIRAVGVELALSGIPTEVLDIALQEDWQNRPAYVYLGVLDSQGQIDGEPALIFFGKMDRMAMVEGKEASIVLSCESEMIDLERNRVRRYTPDDQRSEYPDDAFFDLVAASQGIEIHWGTS